MYGDTLGEAFVEVSLAATKSTGAANTPFVMTFSPATYPELKGMDSAKDIVEVWVDPDVDVNETTDPLKDNVVFSTPFVDTSGNVVLTGVCPQAANRQIFAGTKFRFKITRERSHNTGALAS